MLFVGGLHWSNRFDWRNVLEKCWYGTGLVSVWWDDDKWTDVGVMSWSRWCHLLITATAHLTLLETHQTMLMMLDLMLTVCHSSIWGCREEFGFHVTKYQILFSWMFYEGHWLTRMCLISTASDVRIWLWRHKEQMPAKSWNKDSISVWLFAYKGQVQSSLTVVAWSDGETMMERSDSEVTSGYCQHWRHETRLSEWPVSILWPTHESLLWGDDETTLTKHMIRGDSHCYSPISDIPRLDWLANTGS